MIDIDAHHGNGTQAIFYDDPDVLVGSVHVDPGAGWFPHFLGFADETGAGAGGAPTATSRSRPGAGDERMARGRRATSRGWAARRRGALVVALGVDAAGGDPESPLQVTADGFRAAGRALGALRPARPWSSRRAATTSTTIGALVHETSPGLEEGADG